ncbi:MAG: GNAT family N-acetyltransferase [Candidatus Hydrogenedentes bacterium]|nr:GNAT family N-acetyltransferase [Candidatus Hydrogenedentota bacterium]
MALKTSVFIRRAEREDLETIVGWMEDPAFQRFLYGDPARSPKQIREQIVGMLGRASARTLPMGIYFMADSPKYGPVGLFSVVGMSWRNRSCNIDSYICESRRNGMFGTVAFYRVLEYCFQVLNMNRINIYIYGFNTRSWRLFELTGAKQELVLREHVAREGQLHEMYGYGLLRSEFDKLREWFLKRFAGIDLETMISDYKQQQQTEAVKETT